MSKRDSIFNVSAMPEKFFSLMFLLLVLSSCATTPTKQFVRTGSSYEKNMPQVKNIGLISDACIIRDAVGSEDYYSIEDSKIAGKFMLDSARNYLEGKGYQVEFQISPFVCAFKVPNQTFRVAEGKGAEVTDMQSPFFTDESLIIETEYKESLISLIRQVVASVEQREIPPSQKLLSNGDVQEELRKISEHADAEMLLILAGKGVVVPGGKSFAQGMATGLLTGILTMGMVSVSHYNVSYLDTYVGLVDLRNGEIIWSNSLRLKGINPTKEGIYQKQWPKSILYHIPARTDKE